MASNKQVCFFSFDAAQDRDLHCHSSAIQTPNRNLMIACLGTFLLATSNVIQVAGRCSLLNINVNVRFQWLKLTHVARIFLKNSTPVSHTFRFN